MEIPVFPLSSVLFPTGRLPLQIFEQRYLDLVRDCLKQDTGFGMVWITEGEEVAQPGTDLPALGQTGVAVVRTRVHLSPALVMDSFSFALDSEDDPRQRTIHDVLEDTDHAE